MAKPPVRRGRPVKSVKPFYAAPVTEAQMAKTDDPIVSIARAPSEESVVIHPTADVQMSANVGVNSQETPVTDLQAEIARIRATRTSLGVMAQKLALSSRPGYHRHWFNDKPGRLDEAEAAGWTFVKDKKGAPLRRVVGAGRDNGALFAYAMEIPEVFWQEDQDAFHEQATQKIATTKANPFQSKPGMAKPEDQGKFYSPTEEPISVTVR